MAQSCCLVEHPTAQSTASATLDAWEVPKRRHTARPSRWSKTQIISKLWSATVDDGDDDDDVAPAVSLEDLPDHPHVVELPRTQPHVQAVSDDALMDAAILKHREIMSKHRLAWERKEGRAARLTSYRLSVCR